MKAQTWKSPHATDKASSEANLPRAGDGSLSRPAGSVDGSPSKHTKKQLEEPPIC